MTTHALDWQPTRSAAMAALDDFLPRAGNFYAVHRNEDRGPGDRSNVSRLSPWLRVRALHETEVIRAVLTGHRYREAEKFLQEVCWRTYWKGWLQVRPSVWTDYVAVCDRDRETWQRDERYRQAVSGQTGLDCFDAFVAELVQTGYLHNHARMWFASIWIFTFGLPWQAGADFFLRHLLDGDPASNTLGWRWVAGCQTVGKHYVARADNIRHFTGGRFAVTRPLAEHPAPVVAPPLPPPRVLPDVSRYPERGRVGVVLTDDDAGALRWLAPRERIRAVALAWPGRAYARFGVAGRVVDFRRAVLRDAVNDAGWGDPVAGFEDEHALPERVVEWARQHRLDAVAVAEPPVGFWDGIMDQVAAHGAANGITFVQLRHPWDQACWPHATHGYFRFKEHLPELIGGITTPLRV